MRSILLLLLAMSMIPAYAQADEQDSRTEVRGVAAEPAAQVDDEIGSSTRSVRLGNWLDVHPVGVYGWASDTDDPVSILLKHPGRHKIRIQPRQVPHRIDQVWLS